MLVHISVFSKMYLEWVKKFNENVCFDLTFFGKILTMKKSNFLVKVHIKPSTENGIKIKK